MKRERRGDRIGHRDAREAGSLRGAAPVRRVPERDPLVRAKAEPLERVEIEIGPGLRAGGVAVRGNDRVETFEVSEPAEMAFDPLVGAAAHNGGPETESLGVSEVVLHPGP